eukprot:scaffold131119_cov34-Tisochrysis_lutea.AAC.4
MLGGRPPNLRRFDAGERVLKGDTLGRVHPQGLTTTQVHVGRWLVPPGQRALRVIASHNDLRREMGSAPGRITCRSDNKEFGGLRRARPRHLEVLHKPKHLERLDDVATLARRHNGARHTPLAQLGDDALRAARRLQLPRLNVLLKERCPANDRPIGARSVGACTRHGAHSATAARSVGACTRHGAHSATAVVIPTCAAAAGLRSLRPPTARTTGASRGWSAASCRHTLRSSTRE